MKHLKLVALAAVALVMAASGPLYAAETGVPNPFHTIVDVDFVKPHVKIPMDEDVMVIDSRPKRSRYDNGHIPMAVSIPDREFEKHIDQLSKNKDALLIFYCQGLK
jgi:hypothetical protein